MACLADLDGNYASMTTFLMGHLTFSHPQRNKFSFFLKKKKKKKSLLALLNNTEA